tara:strand:+ start:3229 stop:3411 length:183 start_codon:yes stop_codon:yes gene_type:complete
MKLTQKYLKQIIQEAAAEYVWGVKNPGRVANQYAVKLLSTKLTEMQLKQTILQVLKETEI